MQAPNTVMHHLTLVKAIEAAHGAKPCLFTSLRLDLAAADVSSRIRRLLAKYRGIAQSSSSRDILRRQATSLSAHVFHIVAHTVFLT